MVSIGVGAGLTDTFLGCAVLSQLQARSGWYLLLACAAISTTAKGCNGDLQLFVLSRQRALEEARVAVLDFAQSVVEFGDYSNVCTMLTFRSWLYRAYQRCGREGRCTPETWKVEWCVERSLALGERCYTSIVIEQTSPLLSTLHGPASYGVSQTHY